MKRVSFVAIILSIVVFMACSKSTDNGVSVSSSSSLWPLKTGNTFIYQDTAFDASGNVLESYKDSAFITNLTTSVEGTPFFQINDSLGWFGTGSYVGVGGANTSLFGLDSLNAAPYIFFSEAPYDSYLIGSSQDFSNPTCVSLDALYGFLTTYNVKGYTCYKSVEDITDCNNNITYAVVYYISPGYGVVRIEEYSPNPNSTNTLYLDYSQTLVSDKLN